MQYRLGKCFSCHDGSQRVDFRKKKEWVRIDLRLPRTPWIALLGRVIQPARPVREPPCGPIGGRKVQPCVVP